MSTAVGKAVLEVVARENILDNVGRTGKRLLSLMNSLAGKHDLIGEIRGKGLFIGLELVTDRDKKTPATNEAARTLELMREAGVLVAAIGRHRNIIKIRPPLIFADEHAELVSNALDDAFSAL